jgi:undecaprenyl-diphosphatase
MKPSPLVWLIPLGLVLTLLAFAVDHEIAQAIAAAGPQTKRVAAFVTWFGNGGVLLYPSGILILLGMAVKVARPAREAWLDPIMRALIVLFVIVAAAGIADDLLKVAFGRARPFLWLAGDDSGFQPFRFKYKFNSFPSGHATTSFAAAVALSSLFPRWRPAFAAGAIAIGISRIVLNVHYLSDVVAGAVLGAAVAIALLPWFGKRGWTPYRGRKEAPANL